MKAIVCTAYGPPEVLQLQEIPKPIPKANEVLIKIHAGGVSPSDCAFRKGDPFLVRLIYGLSRPRLATQGVEFAGEVEAVGKGVTEFVVGDQVFGMSPDTFGAHAEYLCLREDKPIAIKPTNVTHAEMAGITDGATTALTFLRDVAKVKTGQRVLINGASGAVGAYGVQLAKYYGAEVTGVCSAANVELVKSLGADRVIDYTRTDFTRSGQVYDVIFDAVGKRSFGECKNALSPNGLYLSTVPTWGVLTSVLWTAVFGRKKAKFVTAGLMQNRDNLNFIATLVEAGDLKAVIDRTYPMEEIVEAHRYVDTGHKKGNVILAINAEYI
jgi:NADPH:quinone reductase-like Zn-dependent oxidoreductase